MKLALRRSDRRLAHDPGGVRDPGERGRGRLGARVRPWFAALCLSLTAGAVAATISDVASADAPSRRAWLGVELDKAPAGGVVAKRVINQSPAAKAGIADGDQLVSADGMPLDEPSQLIARVALLGPGGTLNLKVRHGGTERTVAAQLVPHPGSEAILRLDKINTFAPTWKSPTVVAGSLPQSISALRGKVVIVDFWASWCGPCRLISPQLSKWQTTYGAQGLTVVGFTSDPAQIASQGAQALDMRYAVASDNGEATAAAYGVSALPTLFVIDKKGVIREIAIGYDPGRHKELEKLLEKLLAEKP